MGSSDYYVVGITPHVMACTKELYSHWNNTAEEWMFITNDVAYYVYPAVLGLAVIFTLLNMVVTVKSVSDSHECYLAGFNFASFIMVLASAIIHLPTYASYSGSDLFYRYIVVALPYVQVVENWCFYTCTWLLLTAVAERMGHAMCGRWHASFGRIHGILASLLIIVICFVCTLPQYWELTCKENVQQYQGHNCSRLVIAPADKIISPSGGYVNEYLYYHWVLMAFSIALPYVLLPIMLPPMCCVKMHTYSALSANGHISTYVDDYVSKDYMRDEKSFNRLLSVVVTLYLLLSGPRNAVKLFHNPPFFMSICDNKLMAETLILLFDILFYSFFIILFFVNVCCSSKFRVSLKSLRCRCCGGQPADD